MTLRIAIQPDRVVHKNGKVQSYSERWLERAVEQGVAGDHFDAYRVGALVELSHYDGFMWRFPPDGDVIRFAHPFLNAVEQCLEKPVYPNWSTRWHMEDKIAQSYVLEAMGMLTPRTRIIWRYDEAIEYVRSAEYPLVLKLASGYQSKNVRLLQNVGEARYFIDKLFTTGLASLAYGPANRLREAGRSLRQLQGSLRSSARPSAPGNARHQGYVYLQEFIPGNEHDTRITVIGDRAFGFVRRNRENDFRASGSGDIDWDPERIDGRSVEIAFRIAARIGAQTVAIDTLERDGEVVVLELTLAFASWAVHGCPGHWRLLSRNSYETEWIPGHVRPEDAMFDDFITSVRGVA